MSDPDTEAFEHYEEPDRREPPPGPPHRRRQRNFTQHVPVRFPTSTVEAVRRLAEADGISVSAWIRRAVEQALRTGTAAGESDEGAPDTRLAVARLQRDLAELAAALERSESS